MTIQSAISFKEYDGNGSTTSFATNPVSFFDETDLVVYAIQDSTGDSETLVLNTDYTVSGGAGTTGTVNTAGGTSPYGAPASGYTLRIDRIIPITQEDDFVNNDSSDAEVVESRFDKLTMIAQQLNAVQERSVRLTATSLSTINTELPEPEGNSAIGWNAAGDALVNIELGTGTSLVDLSASTGSALIGHVASGTGSTLTTVQEKLRRVVDVFDKLSSGERADVTARTALVDVTAGLAAAATDISSGDLLVYPPGVYLVSSDDATNEDDYGKKVMHLSGKDNVTIEGYGATIKIVDHDIATDGGLMWLWATGCKNLTVKGFRFDLTFTGVNNSATRYPFCGAVICHDEPDGTYTQDEINGNINFVDCTFKLYHPYGSWATTTSGNDYDGDENNGYKLFSIFCSGDNLATAYDNQNRGATFDNIEFEAGHNGYGLWAWAYNDVSFTRVKGRSYVSKYSDNAGTILGFAIPMIRYHQFYNSGLVIEDCNFRAKPCSERTTSGFEGGAVAFGLYTNLTGDLSHGSCIVKNNTIILGNGDNASVGGIIDYAVLEDLYGAIVFEGNTIDGIVTTTNAYANVGFRQSPVFDGINSITIKGNTWGPKNSYTTAISLSSSSNTSAHDRRTKSLIVEGNTCFSKSSYFLDMNGNASSTTYEGVAYTSVKNNTVIGTYDTVFNKNNANSFGIRVSANQSTDVMIVKDNILIDVKQGIVASLVGSSTTRIFDNNQMVGVTTAYTGANATPYDHKNGTFTPILKGSGTAGTPTMTFAGGTWTRIDNRCFFDIWLAVSADGGATGNWIVDLSGQPFATKDTANSLTSMSRVMSTIAVGAGKSLACGMVNNTNQMTIYVEDNDAGGSATPLTVSDDSTFSLYVGGNFEIA